MVHERRILRPEVSLPPGLEPISEANRLLLHDGAQTLEPHKPIVLEESMPRELLVAQSLDSGFTLSHMIELNDNGVAVDARVHYQFDGSPRHCKVILDIRSVTEGIRVVSLAPHTATFGQMDNQGELSALGKFDPYGQAPDPRLQRLILTAADLWQPGRGQMIKEGTCPEQDLQGYQVTEQDAYTLVDMIHGQPAADKPPTKVFSGRPIRDFVAGHLLRRKSV